MPINLEDDLKILSDTKTPSWEEYEQKSQSYLDRKRFKDTPLTGKILSNSAKKIYNETGTLVPAELALSQAQFETSMGLKGRNPKTNPFNIGEEESGTKETFKSLEEGVDAYYSKIAKTYLKDKKPEDLFKDFVNVDNQRYATDPEYENKISNQVDFINKFWEKSSNKKISNSLGLEDDMGILKNAS